MGLLQVATSTVTSAVASVDLIGTTTDDVYMLAINNFVPSTDAQDIKIRVVESGSPISTSSYDYAHVLLRADTTFNDTSAQNQTFFDGSTSTGNATGECANGIFYIYNANNSSEKTFFTQEVVLASHTSLLAGFQGGCIYNPATQVEGVQIFAGADNIQSGTFTLYKVV